MILYMLEQHCLKKKCYRASGKHFLLEKQKKTVLNYVGINIQHCDDHIAVSQKDFINTMRNIPITLKRRSNKYEQLKNEEFAQLRSCIGQANWVASQTRPDICFDVLQLSVGINKQSEVSQIIQANKTVKKIKLDDSKIIYPRLGIYEDLKLIVFTDASHANLPDSASSAGGHVVFLVGLQNQFCMITWSSNKIKRAVKSTTAAESLTLIDGLEDVMYLAGHQRIATTMFHILNRIFLKPYSHGTKL